MKDSKDKFTVDLVEKRRGRPPNPLTPTPAQRQAARRAKIKEASAADGGKSALYVELPLDVLQALDEYLKFKDVTKAALIERLIRQQLLRKR